jgi:hypothetical protein
MVFIEAPRELASFLKAQAENGTNIVRDEVVELRWQFDAEPEALFVVFWPHGTERIHVLQRAERNDLPQSTNLIFRISYR